MVIRVEDIKEKGYFFETTEQPEAFPALVEMGESGLFIRIDPLHVRLRAIRIQDLVEVEGTVETRIHLSCGRCLEEFEAPLTTSFAVTFTRHPVTEVQDEESEEEIELTAEEMGMIPYQGDEIDLREVVQEQVVMGLPLRPLCDEACRGLCPQCGHNLNESKCGCVSQEFLNKFGALKNFKVDRKKPKEE